MNRTLKSHRWLLAAIGLTCLPATNLCARPQTEEITITAVVTDDADKESSKTNSDEGKKDDAKDGPKERKTLRLQLNKGPVVLMKRLSLSKDESDASGKSADPPSKATEDADDAEAPRIWLGIGLKEVEGDLATYLGSNAGVFIESVFPDSPAETAKLQAGDLVIEFQGQKISGPGALVEALHAVKAIESDKKGEAQATTYPNVSITILRRGQEMKIELTPRPRPADLQITRSSAGDDKFAEGANIFKFAPTDGTLNWVAPVPKTISNVVVVVKEDGKEYIARVESNGDEPAKIIVTEGKEERQLREDQLDQLPEKVRDAIKNALDAKNSFQFQPGKSSDPNQAKAKEQALDEVREQLEKAMKQVGGGHIDLELKDLAESLKGATQGRVIIVDPSKLPDVQKMTEDAKSMAKKWAEVGAEQARGFSKMPEQIKDLKQQVDELRKQVEELREELKASKK